MIRAPFSLEPRDRMTASSQDRALKVLQISDTHLHAAADGRMRGMTTYATFLSVLEQAKSDRRWAPDLIIATGDVVQDESRAGYERFRATLEPLGIPVISIPGNHDDPKLMSEILASGGFQLGGEVRRGPWSLVLLSTFLAGEDAGGLGPARLAGLRQSLAANANQHVLVAMHHHPLPMGSAWLDGVALRDAAAFWEIIDANRQVRAVVCGHVHQASDRERNGVRMLSTPSTCAQFLPASPFFALDERPPGLRWLELHPDGRIDTEVAWVPQRASA
jgi:Icc protein